MARTTLSVTVIKHSKLKIIWFLVMTLVALGGLISVLQGGTVIKYIMSAVSAVAGAWFAWLDLVYIREINKPQLTISAAGIKVKDDELYPWHTLSNIQVRQIGSPKPSWCLTFDAPNGSRKINLDTFDYSPAKIDQLIRSYQQQADQ